MKTIPVKGILTAWDGYSLARLLPFRSESRGSARCSVPAVMPTGIRPERRHDAAPAPRLQGAGARRTSAGPGGSTSARQVRTSGASRWSVTRELGDILPALAARDIYVQLVTSAVREIPREWRGASGTRKYRRVDRRVAARA